MMTHRLPRARCKARQTGLTLIELMISVTIALFVSAGFLFIFVSMNRDVLTQTQLAQLQDRERTVRNLLSDTLQHAGYFPQPLTNSLNAAFPATSTLEWPDGASMAQSIGQVVTGRGNTNGNGGLAGAASDSISVRYQTAPGDGVLNCQGGSNTTGNNATYQNTYFVNDQFQLLCSVNNNTPMVLAEGVGALQLRYGVGIATPGTVDTYMSAEALTRDATWNRVSTIMVTLFFLDSTRSRVGAPVALSQPTVQIIGLKGRL